MQREMTHYLWGTTIQTIADFASASREVRKIAKHFKGLNKRNYQPRILYPVKMYSRNEEEINTLLDEKELRGFFASRPVLKEWLKKVL